MGPLVFDVMISKIQLFGDFCHKVRLDFGLFFIIMSIKFRLRSLKAYRSRMTSFF